MDYSLLSVLLFGFVLGIKHAIEPDHVIAVSTIASHSKSLLRSTFAGIFWGIGHSVTLLLIGLGLILFKIELPDSIAMSFEFLVGIMLVGLGVSSILAIRKQKFHIHEHEHDGQLHKHFHSHQHETGNKHLHVDVSYFKSMLIGLVHGLAGSAAMVLLTMSSVSSAWEGVLYILLFGAGTILGMMLFTTLIGFPFVLSAKKIGINTLLTQFTAAVSIAYGCFYMYNLGITEGLFAIWLGAL
ncbi:sulfite exporter TauE/SafE family protein [Effusibacillus lacus]|uniref:Urease accessory protein UreH n=1 Tax=Effusibacillus lacus TaxID=1348429 RepID=A0A292YKH4_9BACL|nr:sulfite exporter TauE/SafE family protein [Effusibacillus lacus]TCS68410.1 ABC-type nickel/cobalt efflux system permease component RcnA [Effusibacillus lacus]GAX89666.1 urease accessory protein UreH [Effusibacillus lacus]